MKSLKLLSNPVVKFAKGLLVIYSILFVTMLVIQSCKKTNAKESSSMLANQKFTEAMKVNIKKIATVPLSTSAGIKNVLAKTRSIIVGNQTFYLDFPSPITSLQQSQLDNATSLQDIANLNYYSGATLNNQETELNLKQSFDVSIEQVSMSLAPMVSEAKTYLYAKGLTDADINDMLITQGVGEETLVPFVAAMTYWENKQSTTKVNFTTFFFNSANAQSVGGCALEALGFDAGWAIGGSNLSSWTVGAIKKAFGAVAKRFLGPIGVAIAVLTFAYCMWG